MLNEFFHGGSGAGYTIERSLRFSDDDSAYLNKTFSSAGNRQSWTWSGWVKQGSLATGRQCLFGAYGAANDTDFLDIGFDGNSIFATANSANTTGTAKYRDPSAWFHYFVRYNGTNVKWFINGVEAHSWARTGNLAINGAWAHQIGRSPGAGGRHFDGYLADVYFIDGQALAATDFGEYDDNGVWQPKKFEGSYAKADTTDDVYAWKATTANAVNSNGWYFTQEDGSSSLGLPGNSGGHPNELGGNTIGARTGQAVIGAYGSFAAANGVSAGSSAISQNASFGSGTSTLSFVYNKTVNKVWVYKGSSWVGGGNPADTSSTPTFSVPSSGKLSFGIVQNADTEALTLEAIDSSVYGGTATGITFRGSYDAITLSSGNTVATCTTSAGGYKDAWGIELLDSSTGKNSFHLDFSDNSSSAALGTDVSGNGNNWTPTNFVAGLPAEITSITFSQSANYNGAFSFIFYAVRVNGTLVTLTSSEASAQTQLGSTAAVQECCVGNMFDGNYNTRFVVGPPSGYSATKTLTWTPATPLSITDEIEVYTDADNGVGGVLAFSINNLPPVDLAPGGSLGWHTLNQGWYAAQVDSLRDSPTDYEQGSIVGGNYCTWNPLQLGASASLSNGNLEVEQGSGIGTTFGTIGVSSGKWYWEITHNGGSYLMIGVAKSNADTTAYLGSTYDGYGYLDANGHKYNYSSSGYGATYTKGDVIGVALDMDAGTLTFYKNGASQGTAFTGLSGTLLPAVGDAGNGAASDCTANFGQRRFVYTPPAGFKSVCTTNLSDPVIIDGSTAMNVALYDGNDGTNAITGLGFSPDLVWVKARSDITPHGLANTVIGPNYFLRSNDVIPQSGPGYNDDFVSFDSDGFTLGADTYYNICNRTPRTYAAWSWDAGDTTASQSAGEYNIGPLFSSTDYTDGIDAPGGYGGDGKSAVFDGDLSTYARTQMTGSNLNIVFPNAFTSLGNTDANGCAIMLQFPSSAGQVRWLLDGSEVASFTNSSMDSTPKAVYPGSGEVTFDKIEVIPGSGTLTAQVHGIKYRGTLMEDGVNPTGYVNVVASDYRVNQDAGFSIIKVSGVTPGGDGIVGHGLNAVPDMIIEKSISTTSHWNVRHSGLQSWTSRILLSNTATAQELGGAWNVTNPTAQTLSFDWDYTLGASTTDAVFFVWTAIEGYSAFGSYEGNGSVDGPFVYTGLRARWILLKSSTSAARGWTIIDTARSKYNGDVASLYPDAGNEEYNGAGHEVDILSNGFKVRNTNARFNTAGETWIWAAFAEHPMKHARAR